MLPRQRLRRRRRLSLIRALFATVLISFLVFALTPSSGGPHPISHVDTTLGLIDALLDQALHLSLSISPRTHVLASLSTSPAVNSQDDVFSAQACQTLQGRTILLVGPHDILYQLHSFLLRILARAPGPGQVVSEAGASPCPGPSSCPFHLICRPPATISDSPTSTSASAGTTRPKNDTLLRFLHSGTLNPSSPASSATVPLVAVDPRTGVRVIDDPRWVRQAASKADVLLLNRAPLPAPAWSYYHNRDRREDAALPRTNLTWLSTLRALEQEHAEPLADLFADILSRLDHHFSSESESESESESDDAQSLLLMNAALHSTLSTFLPSLLSTLRSLRDHAGHRAILGKKPVLWYGTWYLPVSCAPDSLSILSSEKDPRRLLVRLLAQAEAMDNPWNAYYNAQVYMHDRLLARLLPTHDVLYISSLSTVVPSHVGQTERQAKKWSCIQNVFETPRGALMGRRFLSDFIDALSTWNSD